MDERFDPVAPATDSANPKPISNPPPSTDGSLTVAPKTSPTEKSAPVERILDSEALPKTTRPATVADLHRPKAVSLAEANFTAEERELMKPLRTYQSDTASLVHDKKADVIQINVAEQKRKELKRQAIAKLPVAERPKPVSTVNSARLATIVSIILILLGSGILATIWLFRPTDSAVTFEAATTLISYDQKITIDLSGRERLAVTSELVNQLDQIETPLSSVTYFELVSGLGEVKPVITFDNFLGKIDSKIPEPLRRALGKRFMIGALVFNGVKPFIIFTTDYFDIAFPGMLDWEDGLYHDFGAILGTTQATNPSSAPTDTASFLKLATGPGFSDLVIANRDTRVLRNTNGTIVLVYSFLDKNTVIITPDEVVFKEILNKFLNTQLIR